VSRSIPTIVIDPKFPESPKILVPRADDRLDHAVASDLNWRTLDADLTPLVVNQLGPPAGLTRRRGLIDLLSERPSSANWRIEHPALLKVFGAARTTYHDTTSQPVAGRAAWDAAVRTAQALDRTLATHLDELGRTTRQIDKFSEYYGQLFRSSAVSRFLLIVAVAFLSGLIGILFPSMFGTSLILQVAVSILVLIDSKIGSRRRWQERWLDYRLLAERLRGLRFLHPLGVGAEGPASSSRRSRDAWTDWYVRRTARALGAPAGTMRAPAMPAMAEQLVAIEIREQVHYHRRAFRQLGKLERRLALAANVALGAAIAVGGALGIAAYFLGGLEAVWWKPTASVLLAALPAAMAAFNGIRADGDLVRLVERSAMTAAALARLGRAVSSAPLTYDRVASAAARAAAIMANERSEWRFVLESRRTRTKRRQAMRRHWLAKFRRPQKAS
jgi:ABC-type multidrug transport system fused ATPase/permease subunit